jgi:hypothetical protein
MLRNGFTVMLVSSLQLSQRPLSLNLRNKVFYAYPINPEHTDYCLFYVLVDFNDILYILSRIRCSRD